MVDQLTGRPLIVDGKKVTASKAFSPESAEGYEDIEFTFNAKGLEGRSLMLSYPYGGCLSHK